MKHGTGVLDDFNMNESGFYEIFDAFREEQKEWALLWGGEYWDPCISGPESRQYNGRCDNSIPAWSVKWTV